jgi:secondary thiamine-phosphate synthase enzyme
MSCGMSTDAARVDEGGVVLRQSVLTVTTRGRGTLDITRHVDAAVHATGIGEGLCHLFIRHTSASLLISENADPAVHQDLEAFMARLVPDGDPRYRHSDEGPDDMPAHIRSVLTDVSLTVPIRDGRCALGTWQGIYVWEHRRASHQRSLIITVQGIRGT